MSYILHALKKSEEERNKGTVPRVTTVHDGEAAPRPRFWAAVAVVALLVLAGNAVFLGIGFWEGRQAPPADGSMATSSSSAGTSLAPAPGQPSAEPASTAPAADGDTPVAAAAAPRAEPVEENSGDGASETATETATALLEPAAGPEAGPTTEPDPPIPTPLAAVRLREEPVARAAVPNPPPRKPLTAVPALGRGLPNAVETARPQAAPAARPPAPVSVADHAAEEQIAALVQPAAEPADDPVRSIPELWQLPSQIRSEIPPVTISVHVYSPDEARRFVIIDRRKYWEGDLLEGGLLLESILPDGIVVEFRGRQFKLRSG